MPLQLGRTRCSLLRDWDKKAKLSSTSSDQHTHTHTSHLHRSSLAVSKIYAGTFHQTAFTSVVLVISHGNDQSHWVVWKDCA